MPNNIEFILAAANLINAAGDCIERNAKYNANLIEALAEMQFQLGRYCGNCLNRYWWNEFNRLTLEKINKLHEEKEADDDP